MCGIWWSFVVSELRSWEPLDWESFPGEHWSVALECSLGVWVASVPTETREEEWGMSSGQHPDPEEEQVPNLGGVGRKGKRDRKSRHHWWSRWAVRNGQRSQGSLCWSWGNRGVTHRWASTCHCPGHAIPPTQLTEGSPHAPYSLLDITNCLVTFPIL